MKWRILMVGRGMPAPVRELVEEYRGRLNHFGEAHLEVVAEEKRDKGMTAALAMEREGQRLLARIPSGAFVVALDGSGKMLTSAQFAKTLEGWRLEGISEIVFLIGGPDGLAPSIKASAMMTLSLGPMTYPHMLVRVLILEQLYRAMTLLHGVPYHR